jgi:hypothetical protein
MLERALLGRQAQVVADETKIDPGPRGGFDGGGFTHAVRIHHRGG